MCSPDKRVLLPLSYVPKWSSAGGIRTHGLELMRLAGTASPLRPKGRPRRQSRDGLWSAPQASALVCPAGVEPAISGAQSRRGGQSPLQAEVKNGPKSSRLVEPRPGVGQSDVGVTEALRGSGNRVGAGVSRELLRPRPGVGHGDENVTRLPQPFRSALIEVIMARRSGAGLRLATPMAGIEPAPRD